MILRASPLVAHLRERAAISARRLFSPGPLELRRLHETLFDLFAPGEEVEVAEEVRAEFARARERLWEAVQRTERVQWLLILLSNVRRLGSPALAALYNRHVAGIPAEGRSAHLKARAELADLLGGLAPQARSFADLPYSARRQLLSFLLRSPLNLHRRIGLSLRIFYIRGLYEGRAGRLVAGIGEHGAHLLESAHGLTSPRLLSRLRYSAETGSISGELDYIIIGSGPAGSVIAHELQRAGRKVLVLEAGPFFLPGTYDARAGLDFYEDGGYRTTSDGGIFVLNGWVAGGGATINADMAFSPGMKSVAHRIQCWHANGQIPADLWTSDEMEAAHRWVAANLGTRLVDEHEINEHNRILLKGALKHGLHPSLYQLNTFEPGTSPFVKTDKRDALGSFLMRAITARENPVTLIPGALASRILMQHGRAAGVEFTVRYPKPRAGIIPDPFQLGIPDGATVKAFAPNIVVAGGTLGSAALLLKSGLRNRHIGAGFVMHPFMLVLGLFDHEVNCHLGTPSSIYVADYLSTAAGDQKPDFLIECASARPEIGALLLPGSSAQVYDLLSRYRYIGGIGILLLDSVQMENRVQVRGGEVEVRYRLSETDKLRFRQGVAEGIRIMFKAGARKVIIPTHENILGDCAGPSECPLLTDISQAECAARNLNFNPNQTPLFAAHMMAGNKMGPSPEASVVSGDYQVWGVENLYVVDGSIFPGSIGANPMQSIYTIAKIFVDRHLAKTPKRP